MEAVKVRMRLCESPGGLVPFRGDDGVTLVLEVAKAAIPVRGTIRVAIRMYGIGGIGRNPRGQLKSGKSLGVLVAIQEQNIVRRQLRRLQHQRVLVPSHQQPRPRARRVPAEEQAHRLRRMPAALVQLPGLHALQQLLQVRRIPIDGHRAGHCNRTSLRGLIRLLAKFTQSCTHGSDGRWRQARIRSANSA